MKEISKKREAQAGPSEITGRLSPEAFVPVRGKVPGQQALALAEGPHASIPDMCPGHVNGTQTEGAGDGSQERR